jgi:hypothetical protein
MKISVLSLLATLTAASLVGSGCGSGGGSSGFNVGGPSMCGVVAPCGGDLVGTWTVTVGCVTAAGIQAAMGNTAGCPGASLNVTNVSESGMLTFNADMTYSIAALTEQATYQLTLPVSCTAGGSCDTVTTALLNTGMFESVTCTGASTCGCTAVQAPIVATETGTYTTSATAVTTVPTTGASSVIPYCVQGTNIHLMATRSTPMGAMGQMVVEEDSVGQKQ